MSKIPHCTIEDSDLTSTLTPPGHGNNLQARAGGNLFEAYSEDGCLGNYLMYWVKNFGCGGCWTRSTLIQSGYLSREKAGSPYPTVDYYSEPNCKGTKIHHQGIGGKGVFSCDDIDGAASAVVYQGC